MLVEQNEAYGAARANPRAFGDLRQRRVQTVDVVRGRTALAAQQVPALAALAAELQMIAIGVARAASPRAGLRCRLEHRARQQSTA